MRLPAFARRHPGDHLGAVIERLLRMESAGLAGHALGNDFSVRVDENAHFNSLVLRRAMCLLMSNTAKETTNTAPHNSSPRSEEHTSELQSLMRISYAVFCLKKKKKSI